MKRLLGIILLGATLASFWIAGTRLNLERDHRQVELIYDLSAVQELSQAEGREPQELLKGLQAQGVHSVGIEPLNVAQWLLAQRPLPGEIKEMIPPEPRELAAYLSYPVAFAPADFELVRAAGLQVVPKMNSAPWEVEASWLAYQPRMLILSGSSLFSTKGLAIGDARLGLVEFSAPPLEDGAKSGLARVHGISAAEMAKLSENRILNRYLRAVKERNIRVLYLRPLAGQPWEASLQFLSTLQKGLLQEGFSLGEASVFAGWDVPLWLTALVWAGSWVGAILLVSAWFPRWARLWAGAGFLGWLAVIFLSFTHFHYTQLAMALMTALVFPCLAMEANKGRYPWSRYLRVSAVSLLGAFLVVGTLTGTEYLIKAQEFRGVKLMHIVPILVMSLTVLWPPQNWLTKAVPVKYLIFAAAAMLLGLFYILRTGNFGLPVSSWEIALREFLEKALLVRPRTKEFLLGHPALFFLARHQKKKKSWWAPIAVVGQLSLINTFTHTYTPLSLSLLRTFYGLFFGYLLGWLLLKCYQRGKRWLEGDFNFRLLRFWQSGR